MIVNKLENNKLISEANKWLEVLKKKAYLELETGEKEAVKTIFVRIKDEVKSYQAPNLSLVSALEKMTSVLDNQEGFFWEFAE